MAKTPKDEQGIEFQLRPGVDPFGAAGWRGVDTESDPASLDANQLQRGENIRLRGRIIETRPPLVQRLDLSAATIGGTYPGGGGYILGACEAPDDNPHVRLWFAEIGCYGVALGTGGQVLNLDPSQVPVIQIYSSFYMTSDMQPILGKFGDRLYASRDSVLHEVVQLPSTRGVSANSLVPAPPVTVIQDWPGHTVRCMLEFNGLLFIGLENVAVPATSKIVSWDGLAYKDEKTAINPPLSMGTWRNTLVVGFAAGGPSGADGILWRDIAGTWTTTAAAGVVSGSGGNVMAESRQYLYIAGGDRNIHRWDGAALTASVRTLTEATGIVTSLAIYQGLLHYGWYKSAAGESFIGRHDPDSSATEWNDSAKALTTDVAGFIFISSMYPYRRSLYCGGRKITIVRTLPDNLKGTAALVYTVVAAGNFQLTHIVRFP